MIQLLSKIQIVDNSGANVGRCIKILSPKGKNFAEVGDLILISVQQTQFLKGTLSPSREQISTGDLFKAIVVRAKKDKGHRFLADNAAILVKISPKTGEFTPIGSRIKGPVSLRLSEKAGMEKILSLAKSVL